jgi:hypothetical protein
MDDKFVPHHAYGGREHDAETPDPKCLLCQHDKQLENIKANLRLYSKGDLSAVGAVIAIRKVVEG